MNTRTQYQRVNRRNEAGNRNGHSKNGHADPVNHHVGAEDELPPVGVARSIGSMVSDVLSLTELQYQLFKSDTTEAVQRTYLAISVLLVGSLIILSCLPVGLMALVHLVHQTTELSLGISYAIVMAIGLLFGSLIGYVGFRRLQNVGNVYRRSQEELTQNVRWLKSSLKR